MYERLSNTSILKVLKKYKSNLLLGVTCEKSFDHKYYLTERGLTKVKIGESLTEENLEFFLLEFLTRSQSMREIKEDSANFMIINFKFLSKNFQNSNFREKAEDFAYLKVICVFNYRIYVLKIKKRF